MIQYIKYFRIYDLEFNIFEEIIQIVDIVFNIIFSDL